MKKLYLIGGTMGVGKTTVCRQLKDALPDSVFLDGDWCWDAHPFRVTEETKAMVIDNICHLLNNFIRCSAYEHVIFGWVMHEQSIIDTILDRLETANCEVKCISLTADNANLRERLTSDIGRGTRGLEVIDESMARIPLYQSLNTIKIDTSNKTVSAIVEEIKSL